MTNTIPMDYDTFARYMTQIKTEIEWIEKCYDVGLDMFMDNIKTVDTSIELLEYIFNDSEDYIGIFIFEDNFGKSNFLRLIYDGDYVGSLYQLWQLLVDNYNNDNTKIGVRYV